MKETSERQLIIGNMILWVAAILIRPIMEAFPTSTGETPKIFGLLAPILILILAMASTSFIRVAWATGGRRED